MNLRFSPSLLLLSFILLANALHAQNGEWGAPIPLDSSVITGRLKNGLTYFIRKNGKPEKRAELRLVVRAGSILEKPEQQGLAHFVEHMAFNGTKNFRKQELVTFLESIGMRFGADLNAYTSFDETVYMLQLPVDDPRVVEKGFQILEDWAHNISFEKEEIERERGVVIEEWRQGRGASARIRDRQLPILLHNSLYARRLPIGSREVLDTFKHETLRSFYREWYRPDLMAVIAVGDFDALMIEKMIATHFNTIPKPQNPARKPEVTVPDHEETLFAIESDPEVSHSAISIYFKHPHQEARTAGDYRRWIVEALYNNMLNLRFNEITQRPDPPFLNAYSSVSPFGTVKSFYVLGAAVENNGIERGAGGILTEALRVRNHGFTQGELDRLKQDILRGYEQAFAESDKTESASYAGEYVSYFVEGTPSPGIAYELDLIRKILPGIALDEVNALAGTFITDRNRVVMVSMPEKEGIRPVTREALLRVFDSVARLDITPYVDHVVDRPLVRTPPTPGSVTSTRTIPEVGITEWTLSNGARVVLKPTDFKNDELIFFAFSPGGTSLVSDADYYSATEAAALIDESGLAGLDRIELSRLLTGKVAGITPYIGDLYEGFSGSASPRDQETMFQLIYLAFTEPRIDSAAVLAYIARAKAVLENRNVRPETAFNDTLQATLSQYHPRRRPWTTQTYDLVDPARAYSIYRDRFANAGDFTFVFVGNFTPEGLRPFVETYLAGLPSTGRVERWRDIGVRPPTGVITKEVRRGVEPKSQVRLVFTGPFQWSRENIHTLQSMMDLLEYRFREDLREERGGTYSVGAYAGPVKEPVEQYTITISFGCAPDRVEELTKATFDIIEKMKRDGPAKEDLEKLKETQRRDREISMKENTFWAAVLQGYYLYGENPVGILAGERFTENLTADAVRQATRTYFNMNNYVRVVLYPEK